MTDYEIRPLGPWLEPVTPERQGAHRFRAAWSDTLTLLRRETGMLGADLVVMQVDVLAGQIRRDGMLRADARVGFPGVRVSFNSIHGPLTYATDMYERQWGHGTHDGWQANVRAIALSLEALRAVDRYGVTRRGEQYRGWAQIDSRPAEASWTPLQAAEFIAHWAEVPDPAALLADREALTRAYRAAARRAHPDAATGHADTMARLNAARDLIRRAA